MPSASSNSADASNAAASAAANSSDPYGCATNASSAACQSCSNNPNSSECQAIAAANAQGKSDLGYNSASAATTANNMDVGNLADQTAGAGFQFDPSAAQQNQGASAGGGPQGGGGGGAMSLTGAGSAANLSNPGAARPGSGVGGVAVTMGLRSGGGYSNPADGGPPGEAPSENQGGGRGLASVGGATPFNAFSLKNYLPGGLFDPNRRAGGNMLHPGEIAGKGADMFKNITARMTEKCRLGILFDCK